jgi:hypothetical protein
VRCRGSIYKNAWKADEESSKNEFTSFFPRTPGLLERRYGVMSCEDVKGAVLGRNVKTTIVIITILSIKSIL